MPRKACIERTKFFQKGFSNLEVTGSAVRNYESMLNDHYELRGCDKNTGVPTRRKLEELELSDIAAQLEKYIPLT